MRRRQLRKMYKFNFGKREMKRRLILIKADTFVMSGDGVYTFCLTQLSILPGAGPGAAQNSPSSASPFSGSSLGRDACTALSDRLSIAKFDKTQE